MKAKGWCMQLLGEDLVLCYSGYLSKGNRLFHYPNSREVCGFCGKNVVLVPNFCCSKNAAFFK
jgi:hypothetical protein